MNRFFGSVGYVSSEETSPGVFSEVVTEKKYYGEFLSEGFGRDNSQSIVANINLRNRISLLADQYAIEHAAYLAYVTIVGTKWAIESVTFEGKRMICTLKGIYTHEGGE